METSARNVVNIEETFALIIRRVVEARQAAANNYGYGPPGSDSGSPGLGGPGGGRPDRIQSTQLLGTRRAVTAPLSPLPPEGEKSLSPLNSSIGVAEKGKSFWRKLICWR